MPVKQMDEWELSDTGYISRMVFGAVVPVKINKTEGSKGISFVS